MAEIIIISSDGEGHDISFSSSNNIDKDNTQWGMEQDRELEDVVPKFTIESSKGSTYVTFWTRLRQSSSPALSSFSEEDMESRYQSLLDNTLIKSKNKTLQPCGPSPAIQILSIDHRDVSTTHIIFS